MQIHHLDGQPASSNIAILNGRLLYDLEINNPVEPFINFYEVVRVEKGVALFLPDHLNRLYNGVIKQNHSISVNRERLGVLVGEMIDQSGAETGNVKIEFIFQQWQKMELYYRAYFIPTFYPASISYSEGVKCILLPARRPNPTVKIANPYLREESDRLMAEKGVYETILHSGEIITEGSRSNIFFVKNGVLQTAPDEMVLGGIIREKIIGIALGNNIEVRLSPLRVAELKHVDAVFITGTSPRVLPVNQIGDHKFTVPDTLTTFLRDELMNLISRATRG